MLLPEESLYDLIFDPTEHHNLAEEDALADSAGGDEGSARQMDEVDKRPTAAGSGTRASWC